MTSWLPVLLFLAADEPAKPAPNQGIDPFLVFLLPLVLILLLGQFMFANPARREKKHLDALVKVLKKNDRVVTMGGIIGTVAQVNADKREVTIKVDDNTRLKMELRSIREVLKEKDSDGEPAAKS